MSQHSSLRSHTRARGRHRNVLKRYERIKRLVAEEKWSPQESPYGLLKVRSIKVRVKKEKTAAAAGAAQAEGAPAEAAETPEKGPPAPEKKKAGSKGTEKK